MPIPLGLGVRAAKRAVAEHVKEREARKARTGGKVKPEELTKILKLHQEAVRQALVEAAYESGSLLVRRVIADPAAPVDLGIYKNSWEFSPTGALEGVVAEVNNDAPYAGIIELGARPHWPPFAPLYEWAKRKAGDVGIAPTPFRGPASLTDDQDKAAARFARAVQVKISRVGQKPLHIMKKQLPWAIREMKRQFERRLRELDGKPSEGT